MFIRIDDVVLNTELIEYIAQQTYTKEMNYRSGD